MAKKEKYVSIKPDEQGYVRYSVEANRTWKDLYARQYHIIQNRACREFIAGLHKLQLNPEAIPQIPDINAKLKACTGWEVTPVPALIDFEHFFDLLSKRKFPAATFIRRRAEFDYLQEPDIFHEVFGHCPLLTNPIFADFAQHYGELGKKASAKERLFLARLYWFTVEFGLIQTPEGLRIYGGGILSSVGETQYAIESALPNRQRFNLMDILRTPYRIDIFQPAYFVLNSYQQLYDVMQKDILQEIKKAHSLGLYPPLYKKNLKT